MGSSSNHPEYPDPSLLINVSNFVSIKLSASNYQLWKTQMRCFIDNVGLLGFIDGTTPSPPPPPSSSSNDTMDEYRRWKRLDQRLKGWILGSLSEEVLPTVVDCDTASDVWIELQRSFGPYLQPRVQIKENLEHEAAGMAEVVKNLRWADLRFIESMTIDQLELQTTEGNTALSVAAMVGNAEAAEILVAKHPSLLYIENCNHSLPMHMAAKYAHRDTLSYLLKATEDNFASDQHNNPFEGQSGVQLLVDVILSGFIGEASYLVQQYPGLAILKTEEGDSPLAAIARKPSAFRSGNRYHFWEKIISFWYPGGPGPFFPRERSASALRDQVAKGRGENTRTAAFELVNCLCTKIRNSTHRHSYYRLQWKNPIRQASRLGTHEVVEAIVSNFFQEIWSNIEDRNCIILLAVKYRCKNVLNLIDRKGHRYAFSSVPRDASGNNILHIAAKLAPPNILNLVSGAALQMQSELQWFKEVQMLVDPCCKEEENSSKQTPQMVFTKEHNKLLVEGERWMKKTANSCTIVAALIATIVFAATITVPGGNNGNNGHPIFFQRRAFKIFYFLIAYSFSASVSSLLTFLPILTSRCAEEDFLIVLPNMLLLGFFFLFASITSMMIAFISIYSLVPDRGYDWIGIAIYAIQPILMFWLFQTPLLSDLGRIFKAINSSLSPQSNSIFLFKKNVGVLT